MATTKATKAKATKATTIEGLARQLCMAFEGRRRGDGTYYRRLEAGSPRWMRDLASAVHGDRFEDDWRYRFMEDVAVGMVEQGEAYDGPGDNEKPWSGELTSWLGGLRERYDRCDAVATRRAERGEGPDTFATMQAAFLGEKREVYAIVRDFLAKLAGPAGWTEVDTSCD